MTAHPRRTERGKALCLACCNVDGVHGRKLELDHFLNRHGVNICLLSETFLNLGETFQLASYVCHRTDRLTGGCGTAFLFLRVIVHHSLPVPWLGGYCRSSHTGWQTSENPCGLPSAFLPTDLGRPDHLFQQGIASLDGR